MCFFSWQTKNWHITLSLKIFNWQIINKKIPVRAHTHTHLRRDEWGWVARLLSGGEPVTPTIHPTPALHCKRQRVKNFSPPPTHWFPVSSRQWRESRCKARWLGAQGTQPKKRRRMMRFYDIGYSFPSTSVFYYYYYISAAQWTRLFYPIFSFFALCMFHFHLKTKDKIKTKVAKLGK